MDHKELLQIADAVSREKGISKEEVLTALEEGMETSLRKNFPEGATISVQIDSGSGHIQAYRTFQLVDQIENIESEMLTSEIDDEIVKDGVAYEPFDFVLDRQKFNITKQVALQKIKQGSREHQFEDLVNQPIALFDGNVKVVKKDQLIIDYRGLDITIYRNSLLPQENYQNGDRISFTLEKQKNQYVGTRVSDQYLIEVMKNEITQIEEGDIEIVSVARNPGFRSKVIVKSNSKNIEAVRVCVGARGSNINAVKNMLSGEAVDVIEYNENPAQMLISALQPVSVTNISIDEDTHTMDVGVHDDDISKAIGKNGKNVELIAKLIGWTLNIVSQTQWKKNEIASDEKIAAVFESGLGCDLEVANMLISEGFSTLEEIAYVPRQELYVEGLDDETIDALRTNAKDTLSDPIALAKAVGNGELLLLGLDASQRETLQSNGVFANNDVADLATFELVEFVPEMEEQLASQIIMKARQYDTRSEQ
jgi:N utilization substance protein A